MNVDSRSKRKRESVQRK